MGETPEPCLSNIPGLGRLEQGAPLEVFCAVACKLLTPTLGMHCQARTAAEIAAYLAGKGALPEKPPAPNNYRDKVAKVVKNLESASTPRGAAKHHAEPRCPEAGATKPTRSREAD